MNCLEELKARGYILYKYYPFDKIRLNSLVNNKIWLSTPEKYNDPFEFHFTLYPEVEEVARRTGTEHFWVDIREEYNAKVAKKIEESKRKFCLCCFSEEYKNILMWSHYAENHKGICVEYDFRNYRKVLYLEKVKYANDVVKFPQGGFEGFNRIFCTKALPWSYEHEWRLILNAEKAGEMNAPKINRIFLGCEFDHTGELSENLKGFAQRKSIPLFQMKKSPTKYTLEETPCSE
ncbi:MAG: DUF2971 domain-containing protein [Acutalibacteraceae bacterium]